MNNKINAKNVIAFFVLAVLIETVKTRTEAEVYLGHEGLQYNLKIS
jgi:hypothetical protein